MIALAFLKAHWRAFAAGLALLLAFAGGRYSGQGQTRTEYVDDSYLVTTKAEAVTRVVYRDRVVTHDRSVITHPDGTVEKKDIEQVHDSEGETDKTEHAESKATETVHEKTSVAVSAHPAWSLGAGVLIPLSFKDAPFVAVHVDRQILGPLSVGLWGSIDIHGQAPALGVGIGLTF